MFTVQIETGNAAFEDEAGILEVGRLLESVIDAINGGETSGVLEDFNGNTVGSFTYNDS